MYFVAVGICTIAQLMPSVWQTPGQPPRHVTGAAGEAVGIDERFEVAVPDVAANFGRHIPNLLEKRLVRDDLADLTARCFHSGHGKATDDALPHVFA